MVKKEMKMVQVYQIQLFGLMCVSSIIFSLRIGRVNLRRPFFLYLWVVLIYFQVMRFFSNPRKPMILALARPDPKKNITTLVKAFGEHHELRNLANLVCVPIL
jgi:hypothetical protein